MTKINIFDDLFFDESQIHSKNHENAIVMFSGGMDSAVALWWALDNYKNVKVFSVNYNQPHVIELTNAEKIITLTNANHDVLKVDIPNRFWGIENRLTRGQACFMTSLAALDIGHDGADIVMGILKTDVYGDCDRSFLDDLGRVLYHPEDTNFVSIATPLRAVNEKCDVIALGFKLGAPLSLTWTCRNPDNGVPCHKCMQCKQRDEAIYLFERKYGIKFETVEKWNSVYGSPCHPSFNNIQNQLEILAKAFLQMNKNSNAEKCWCYYAPDGLIRVATHIHNVNKEDNKKGTLKNVYSVHGYLDNNYRWEVCICDDGKVASTEKIPDIRIIEKKFVEKYLNNEK